MNVINFRSEKNLVMLLYFFDNNIIWIDLVVLVNIFLFCFVIIIGKCLLMVLEGFSIYDKRVFYLVYLFD